MSLAGIPTTTQHLSQQVSDWQRLHTMSVELLKARSLREQFGIVLKTVTDFHRTGKGVISLFDPQKGGLIVQASAGLTESGLTHLACVPVGAGECGIAFQDKHRVVIADTEVDPVYAEYVGFAREQGIRALYSSPFFDTSGEPLGVLSVYYSEPTTPNERELQQTDICAGHIAMFVERERAEMRLNQERACSHRILQTLKDGFVLMDSKFRVLQINAAGLAMDGRQPEEILGRTHWEAWPGSEELEIGLAYKQVMRECKPVTLQHCYDYFGRMVWFDVHAYPQDNGVAVINRDITESKQAENNLRRLAANLSEENRRKTEFLATLAHELRNPLAPIRTGLDLIRLAGNNPASSVKVHKMMDRQFNQMVHLIDDLLDIARINSGKVELRKERLELRDTITTAIETALPMIEAAQHKLDVCIPDEPFLLFADATRLAQIVSNLLTNAAKYTPNGGQIRLIVTKKKEDVAISVTDTGIGIPVDALPGVFDMFTQVSRNIGRAQGGLGIGLSLVRGLVQMHGGIVDAFSEGEGKGSTFTVQLPLILNGIKNIPGPEQPSIEGCAIRTRRLKILVADDNVDAAHMMLALLQAGGHTVEAVHDGETALARAKAVKPDLILLDIGMPGLTGYEVAASIRKTPGMEQTVLAALTGWGADHDRNHSREAGFDAHLKMQVKANNVVVDVVDDGIGIEKSLQPHLFKLFSQGEQASDRAQGGLGIGLHLVKNLVELHGGDVECVSEGVGKGTRFTVILRRYIDYDDPSGRKRGDEPESTEKRRRCILLVDDNVDAANMLAMYLQANGHTVLVEYSPTKAIERARAEKPDLCILDIGLPEIDGYELVKALREQKESSQASFIALTGYGPKQGQQKAISAGFDYHLVKPVDMKQLEALMENFA